MAGQVFVVRADLTRIECDAWLLPSDRARYIEPYWTASAGESVRRDLIDGHLDRATSPTWGEGGSRSELIADWWDGEGPLTWLTDVGGDDTTEVTWFIEGVREFVEGAASYLHDHQVPRRNRRAKHLLAVPLVGTGEGGASKRKGEIVAALLALLTEVAVAADVDVVLTTWSSEAFAAVQGVRRRDLEDPRTAQRLWPDLGPGLTDICRDLGRRAIEGDLVLFLGAGVSAAAGLPLWKELLRELAREVDLAEDQINQLAHLNVLDQARLLERRYAAQNRRLAEQVIALVSGRRYALTHALLANLPSREIVTVNYDELFEHASRDAGHEPAVLPYHSVVANQRWLLKLHGSVENPDDIVLTRSDYLAYADRRAALAGIVQSLLITRHMLFVGFSLTDDNFNRIAEDVRRVLGDVGGPGGEPSLGTALLLHDDPMMTELWRQDLRSVHLGPPAGEVAPAARRLEIFLDCLLTFASSNVSHLLDDSFKGLLDSRERELKDLLTELTGNATEELRASPYWTPVAEFLSRFGSEIPGASARHDG